MKFYFTLIIAMFALIKYSNAQFKLDSEIRNRGMINHGFRTIPTKQDIPAFLVSQRTRLNLNYNNDAIETRLSFQDVRIWGDDNNYLQTGLTGNTNSISVFESWVKLFTTEKLFFKIGRQQWKYDDERILAGRNWLDTGMSYDGVLTSYAANDKLTLDLGLSLNNNSKLMLGNDYRTIAGYETDSESGETIIIYEAKKLKTLNFLHINYDITEKTTVSAISLLSGAQNTKCNNLLYLKSTTGTNLFYESDNFFGHFSGYYQTGKSQTGKNVSAYLLSAEIGYSLSQGKIKISIGADIISGDEKKYSDKTQVFDLLYGARYKFYGHMNHFTRMDRHTNNAGLINPYLKTALSISPKDKLFIDLHYFRLANELPNHENGFFDPYLSSEVNILYNRRINPIVNLRFGLSYSLPGESLNRLRGINPEQVGQAYYFYTMLAVKPIFFKK